MTHTSFLRIRAGDTWEITAIVPPDDARLLSAARDLLDVAKDALAQLDEDGWTDKEPLIRRLRAAITKAEILQNDPR